MKKKLTPKQKKFIREYKLNGGNATKAAIKAGYSKKTAEIIGFENLRKPNIKAALEQKEAELEKKYDISEERIIRELELIGFSDLKNYIDIETDTGAVRSKGFKDMPGDSSRALESISEDRIIHESYDGSKIVVNDKRKFKTHSKIEALKLLANIKGMTREKDSTPQVIIINAEKHH